MKQRIRGGMPAALILAGGKGKRLLPLTEHCPKPLLPVGGRPLLLQILEDLAEAGVHQCIVTAGYGAEQIRQAVERFGREEPALFGMDLRVIAEERPRGSAGCLSGIGDLLRGDRFFVVCGDVYGKRDYAGMAKSHLERGAFATLFLTRISHPEEYGLVELGQDGRILSFLEKPTWSQTTTDLANGGIYLFEREVLNCIPNDIPSDFGKDIFPALLSQGRALYGFLDGGYWHDVGDRRAYLACNLRESGGKSVIGQGCIVKGRVERSVLLEGVVVEQGSYISQSVIGRGCIVGKGCILEEDCVLGDGCVLGEGCHLERGTVLEGDTRLEAGRRIKEGSFAGRLQFEENELLLKEGCPEDFFIRLGYALAGAAGGPLLLMHGGRDDDQAVCAALLRGACLAGGTPAAAGEGFYAYCGGLTAFYGFSLGALCTRGQDGGGRICLFDRAGLPANGRLIRRIRDCFSSAVICGRVGRVKDYEADGRTLYKRALTCLSGIGEIAPFSVGMEVGSLSSRLLSSLLEELGHTVLPYGKGAINLYLSPDGRRCSAMEKGQDREIWADFWHICAILLYDRVGRGGQVYALPRRAPEALFSLAEGGGSSPLGYALQSAAALGGEERRAVLLQREPLDGSLAALLLLETLGRRKTDLGTLLREVERACPFGISERTLDCAPEEKLPLLLSLGASPAGEGVRKRMKGGAVRVRACGGRGLSLMAEAASESDAATLLEEVRRKLLEQQKRMLHSSDRKEKAVSLNSTPKSGYPSDNEAGGLSDEKQDEHERKKGI